MKRIIIFCSLLLIVLLSSCEEKISFEEETIILESNNIVVEIKGEVKYPGIYTLEEGALLIDLVRLAGGFNEYADTSLINLVLPVNNNQMIIIPKTNVKINNIQNLVNINTASIEELMNLPGIGEAKAKKIVEYRQEKGMFSSINDLKNISGISDAIFEKIKTLICI